MRYLALLLILSGCTRTFSNGDLKCHGVYGDSPVKCERLYDLVCNLKTGKCSYRPERGL